ncbi:MAG: hypothetical protein R3322_00145 [Kiloniellales bacterium]|nr:hypothetical protein [Kiloniellales bacterium]
MSGAWEHLQTLTVPAGPAVSTFGTFSGLDGDTDRIYSWLLYWVSPTTADLRIRVSINGSSPSGAGVATTIGYQRDLGSPGLLDASGVLDGVLVARTADNDEIAPYTSYSWGFLHARTGSPNGRRLFRHTGGQRHAQLGDASQNDHWLWEYVGQWFNTVTNITSLGFECITSAAAASSSISPGSFIALYRMQT